ncbi:MAG: tetratricopeptide repeat protein [Phycisphaeraceae bacterium]|nr:tetratricopeptide repeat protein [Phycisphaerales bacterium]MCB9843669.1 tetratricopeptide repeat protein [Phycisphaeraceae bacterium]
MKTPLRLLSASLAAWLTLAPLAQAQDAPPEEPFHLDLPEWNPDPEDLPPELRPLDIVRPTLPDDVADEVAQLEARIAELEELGLTAETKEEQDAALEQAIDLAEQVLAIRVEHQGNTDDLVRWRDIDGNPSEWWEVADARRLVGSCQYLKLLNGNSREELARVVPFERVSDLFRQGQIDTALRLVRMNLDIRHRLLGPHHPDTLDSSNNEAFLLKALGIYDQAHSQFVAVLAQNRDVRGEDHPQTVMAMINLGDNAMEMSRHKEAAEIFSEALSQCKRVFGPDNEYTISTISRIGTILHLTGRIWDAEPFYRLSLYERLRVFGWAHPDSLTAFGNLGTILEEQGKLREAEPYFSTSLSESTNRYGPSHPSTLTHLHNMGFFFQRQGRLADAEQAFRAALIGRIQVLGENHRHTIESCSAIGVVLWEQSHLTEALPYFQKVLDWRMAALGPDHADTLSAMSNMGILLDSMGHHEEAETLLQKVLHVRQKELGDNHPDVFSSQAAMGGLLRSQGSSEAAQQYLLDVLESRREHFGNSHPKTIEAVHNLGVLYKELGRFADSESLLYEAIGWYRNTFGTTNYRIVSALSSYAGLIASQQNPLKSLVYYEEALSAAESLRSMVAVDATSRAQFARKLSLLSLVNGYALTLTHLSRQSEALSVLERGRSRAALDMFAGGRGAAERVLRDTASDEELARYQSALDAEQEASEWVFESEARMAAAPDVEQKEHWRGEVRKARMTLSEKTAAVFSELRGLVPAADPMTAEQILDEMRPDEALLTFAFTEYGSVALIARDNDVHGYILTDDKDAQRALNDALASLRAAVSSRASTDRSPDTAIAAARSALLPSELLEQIDGIKSLTVVADGTLTGVPMELLIPDIPIAYAPSATIAMKQRNRPSDAETGLASAVIVGDPVFAGAEEEPDYPESGLLLAMVVDDSNAAIAGMQRGDVLVAYGQRPIASMDDLRAAVGAVNEELATRGGIDPAARTVSAELWRNGELVKVALAPGSMGVQLDQRPPAEGLRSMKFFDRSWDQQAADASALEQVRLYGGALSPLPSTRLEATSVASMFGDGSTLLVGSDANAPNLRNAVKSQSPRVLHLATHGLLGSSARPLLASLALSTPDEPSIDDTGFLTLEEVLNDWGGSLQGTELVVLSACDTANGIRQGDTAMTLPLGFFVCGADTVIASLWKVDDRATALLMARFYANWLGKSESVRSIDGVNYDANAPMPKLAALREARQWLRSLTQDQVDAIFASDTSVADAAARGPAPRRGELADPLAAADNCPYDHPYYYSAFILQGSPE